MSCKNETPEDVLARLFAEPQSVTGDQGSITNRSIPDLIAADQYLRKIGMTQADRLARIYGSMAKIVPPSARGT